MVMSKRKKWNCRIFLGTNKQYVEFYVDGQIIPVPIPQDKDEKQSLIEVIATWMESGFEGYPAFLELKQV